MTYDFSKIKNKSEEVKNHLKKEVSSLHSSRANPALVEDIMVDSYGTKMPVKHVATISVEDARTLRITPWDISVLKNIEIALSGSNLGGQPIADKQSIRIALPELSEERRKAIIKVLSEKLEEAKISLRQERDEVWKDIQEKERKGEIPEDDKFRFKEELQKMIDKVNEELEEVAERKKQEIIK
ncbi:MAG: ribosome-recycling factor [Candidatus Parcubacteria bacterium]|nr:ribosome-recycling factor [Candidatus Parcubacteria bacterium]